MDEVKKHLKIVFMGTPDFAVPSLKILLANHYNVVGVITAPDKPAGRGLQLQQSPIKKVALENALPVLQPVKLKDPAFLESLRNLNPDLQIVVAFRMLPEAVWQLPPIGTINLHGSLLPQYRGAAPINWAIMNGEKETGVTTFFLQHEIDTGKILFREKMAIAENETAGMLHDRMKEVGAALVLRTVNAIASGNYSQTPQEESNDLKKAPKIFSKDCEIDWRQPIEKIYNQVRGLSPYPAAFTLLHGKVLKILSVSKIAAPPSVVPGKWLTDGKKFLHFAAANGYIALEEVKMEGKKLMVVEDFLRGYRFDDPPKN